MHPHLRDRILRHLETLPDEKAYQVLDFIEFLESRYSARADAPALLQRFAERVEDALRAGRVPAAAVAEAMGLLGKAISVLGGVAAAGRSVATELLTAGQGLAVPARGQAEVGDRGEGVPAQQMDRPKV
jgi:hypothetical protein